MKIRITLRLAATFGAAALATACSMDTASGLKRTPPGAGPSVRFDLAHTPLPDVPIPNDVATWPDPTSRTGLRLNTRMFAPTSIETDAREKLDRMEGWGTYGAITLAFDKNPDLGDAPAIDLQEVMKRHQKDDYDFQNDAIYLVDLTTGVPVPLDLGEGAFNYTLKKLDKYWRNDTRATEQNTLWETYDETAGLPPGTKYRPELDTDFDGVLDVPNFDDPKACATAEEVAGDEAKTLARQQCVADHLLTWYERQTDTMIVRPLVPLQQKRQYAVVVTDRLVDPKGRPVRSPFDYVYHPSQEQGIARLQALMGDPAHAAYWGDLGASGLDHVAFAWTFTTAPTTEDMQILRDGLYGQGPFASIGDRFPPKVELLRASGFYTQADLAGGTPEPPYEEWSAKAACQGKTPNLAIVKIDAIPDLLQQIVEQVFGFTGAEEQALLDSWSNLDYIAIGTYKTPFFVEGGPKGTDPHAAFHLNFQTGEGEVGEDTVQFWMLVPKQTAQHHQPFPVALYGHGYTGNSTEGFLYAGTMARLGVATIGINAVGHGLTLDPGTEKIAKALFSGSCLAPLYDALLQGRARDLNGDGIPDSGGDFWTSYLFHTRDVVRQSVLDQMQLTRILRTFDGRPGDTDFDRDGIAEKAGDFDADGTPDVGGPTVPLATWGQSLGAFLSSAQGGLDHQIQAAAPTSGGAMIDVGLRTFQGGVVEAVTLRLLGPLVVGVPAAGFVDGKGKLDPAQTSCASSDVSLRFVVPDLNDSREVEFGCAPPADLPANGATVVMKNLDNGQVRCARVGDESRFRLGVPSSVGDRLTLEIYHQADAVEDYGSCRVKAGVAVARTVTTWGKGTVAQGTPDPVNPEVIQCPDAASCTRFQRIYFAEGSALSAPADGYGFTRQSPEIRGFFGISQHILDPADGISYMSHYALDPIPDPYGNPGKPKGLLDIQTIGDMNVPISAGIAYGRAAGALPFFTAEQAARYPEWADHAVPTSLLADFGGVTPNRFLIDHFVTEGIDRLQRTPAGAACMPNWTQDTSNVVCNPHGCKSQGTRCPGSDVCGDDDVCHPAANPATCARTLYDPDALAEGKQLFDAQSPKVPLRLARIAAHATPGTLDACASGGSCASPWAPRLLGKPFADDDASAWKPSAPVVAMLDAMVEPEGTHCFVNPLPCKNFDESLYLTLVVSQFFRTSGQDLYYLSHPSTHHCLESLTCPLLTGE